MYIDYKNRIFGLDVLRAIAILFVLFSHSTLLIFPNQKGFIIKIFQFFGTIGVDLFFVLSGYLIGGLILKQLQKGKIKFKDFQYFWLRRWFRTLPNYFLILILNIFVLFLLNGEIVINLGHYFVFLQNFNSPHPEFFAEAWSLSIEEYAYIVGPLLLYISIVLFSNKRKTTLFLIVTLLVIFSINFLRVHFHFNTVLNSLYDWSHQIRKVVIYRLDAVYYGFLAVLIISKYRKKVELLKVILFSIGTFIFFAIHITIFYFDLQVENSSLFYNVFYLPLISISLLLLFPVFINWNKGKYFKKIITKISIMSYSLYLINYSLVLLTIQHFFDVLIMSIIEKVSILFLFWLVSFTLSYFLYKYYEKPITDLRDINGIKNRFNK